MSDTQARVLRSPLHGIEGVIAYDPLREQCTVNHHGARIQLTTERRWQFRYTFIAGQEHLGIIHYVTQSREGTIRNATEHPFNELVQFHYNRREAHYETHNERKHPAQWLIERAHPCAELAPLASVHGTQAYDPISASALLEHDGHRYETSLVQNQHGHFLDVGDEHGSIGSITIPRGQHTGLIRSERHSTPFSIHPYIVDGQPIHPVTWLLQHARA